MQNIIDFKVYVTSDCFTCPDQDKMCHTIQMKTQRLMRNWKVINSKKVIILIECQEIYYGRGFHAEGNFGILLESRNFIGIEKNWWIKRVNDELKQHATTHNY